MSTVLGGEGNAEERERESGTRKMTARLIQPKRKNWAEKAWVQEKEETGRVKS